MREHESQIFCFLYRLKYEKHEMQGNLKKNDPNISFVNIKCRFGENVIFLYRKKYIVALDGFN